MSTNEPLPDAAEPCDQTPVVITGAEIEPSPTDLKKTREKLDNAECVPSRLDIEASFCEDCPLAVQRETDRITEYVRAADFLGARHVRVVAEIEASDQLVDDAIEVCRERAESDGLTLEVTRC